MILKIFEFPVGYVAFHPKPNINFQLNRWYSLGYARREDMVIAGQQIGTMGDWKGVLITLAKRAESEGRWVNAAFYYRAAEFFTLPSDLEKELLYKRFTTLFYTKAFPEEPIERYKVPYGNSFLPALRIPAPRTPVRGTIVIHGGFDSYIEEFYSWATYFASHGYDVILFEGPGQGAALKKYGLPLTYEWERPVKAVLDHLALDSVTLIGISMGGWLCFRAAAFEPRIQRVVASSIAFDYLQILPGPVQGLMKALLRWRGFTDVAARWKMRLSDQERWGINNLMYITKTDSPMDATEVLLRFNEENLHSDRVHQDILILTGAEDHFIPLKMHHKQVQALTKARSVTARIFSREEQAQNHCQIGNIGLALQVMRDWIEERT